MTSSSGGVLGIASKFAFGLALSMLLSGSSAFSQTSIGKPFPHPGEDVEWIKGRPIVEFARGHVYLLDFWATWCPPCMAMIPHTNDLARRYSDRGVSVIGLAVMSGHGTVSPQEFVKKQGERMAYTIGVDTVNRYTDSIRNEVGVVSLPVVVIVDQEGRVAWFRSGFDLAGLEAALQAILDGRWDHERAAERERTFMDRRSRAARHLEALDATATDNHSSALITILEQEPRLGYMAVEAMSRYRNPESAFDFAERTLDADVLDGALHLQDLAATVLRIRDGDPRGLELARRAALAADRLAGQVEPWVAQTLAKVEFAHGALREAVAAQRRAVAVAEQRGWPTTSVEALRNRLRQYEKAASGAGGAE